MSYWGEASFHMTLLIEFKLMDTLVPVDNNMLGGSESSEKRNNSLPRWNPTCFNSLNFLQIEQIGKWFTDFTAVGLLTKTLSEHTVVAFSSQEVSTDGSTAN